MANIKEQIDDMFGELDTAIAMTDKVSEIAKLFNTLSLTINLQGNIKPFELIMELLQRLKITHDDLVDWLASFLCIQLPIIEVGVKGVLLANLKGLISCSIDPRIPDYLRKSEKDTTSTGGSAEGTGIAVSLKDIDYFGKLQISPLGVEGKYKYFQTQNIQNVYELIRAKDMDAFLWFAIHKGKFPQVQYVGIDSFKTTFKTKYNMDVAFGDSFLEPVTLTLSDQSGQNSSKILPGNVFAHSEESRVISMCMTANRKEVDGYEKVVQNQLLPVSSDWASVNWYTNSTLVGQNLSELADTKLNKETGEVEPKARDYYKDVGICNFQYEDNNTYGSASDILRFTILPKVAQHFPRIDKGDSILSYRKLRFNQFGEPDSKGRYSYPADIYNDKQLTENGEWLLTILKNGVQFKINRKTGKYEVDKPEKNKELLQECYPGLTVFEFNYDYIMSMRLFDSKVLASSIIDAVLNLQLGVNANLHWSNAEIEMNLVKEIIKEIVNQDDSEIEDCYYSFSNDRYDTLLRFAEEKYLNQQRFGTVTYNNVNTDEIKNILSSFEDQTSRHEQVNVLKRAIQQASVKASENSAEPDKNKVEINFLFNFIEELISAIIHGVLSPKVLLLIAINTEMMGGNAFNNLKDFKDILKTLQSLLVGIIRNIKDLIMQELMKLVLKELRPVVDAILSMLTQEVLSNYIKLIRQLIENCDMSFFFALLSLFKNKYSDTELDLVDYPDIDTSIENIDKPKPSC